MDLLRKYLLSSAMLRAPDDPPGGGTGDPPAGDPPVDPNANAGGDPPAGDPPVGDPPPAPASKQPPKWALDRISEETARREAAEQRAREAEALAARLQARGNDPGADPKPTPVRADPPANIDALVDAETTRRELNRESTAIRSAGVAEYGPGFAETLRVLHAVGAVEDAIVLDLAAVDRVNAHKILATLAQDPERAASFAQLDPRRRIAEITRMSDALKTPPAGTDPKTPPAPVVPPKTVSKAPAPPPPVDPSAVKSTDWRDDKASDAEFSKGWNENFEKRRARR